VTSNLKKAGKFKVFKRTEGVSTTDIVGKLMLFTKVIILINL
jgi:ethanolamine-phosphate cytidylyltransferase